MKKQFLISGILILLLLLGLSGCLENPKNDDTLSPEAKLFIGKWKTTIYYYNETGNRFNETPSNSTFYTNGTMGSESVSNNETVWTPYAVKNNTICFGKVTDEDYLCYYYDFSEDGTLASLMTIYQDPYYGDEYQIIIDMSKY